MKNRYHYYIAILSAIAAFLLIICGFIQYYYIDTNYKRIIEDAGNFQINISGDIVNFDVNVKLNRTYITFYSSEEIPISVSISLDKYQGKLDNITVWFYYADKQNHGVCYHPKNEDYFKKISVEPGKTKTVNGTIIFSKSGTYNFYINNNKIDSEYHLYNINSSKNVEELKSTIKSIPVDDGFKLQQIKNNAAIKGLSFLALGASFSVIGVMYYQIYLNNDNNEKYIKNIKNKIERENRKLIYRLDDLRKVLKGKNKKK